MIVLLCSNLDKERGYYMIHPLKLVSIFLLSATLFANETFEISDATIEKSMPMNL
ncbi:MAG: hypothetical protein HWD61_12970 [Parachlamydiaceae bacterium]|nr:MAG: hypothetical protein HWD61_12970 [Parachlamydiaceae bacterium]